MNYTIKLALDYNDTQLKIYFSLSGYDKDSYKLNDTSLVLPVIEKVTAIPHILSASVIDISKSSVNLTITSD